MKSSKRASNAGASSRHFGASESTYCLRRHPGCGRRVGDLLAVLVGAGQRARRAVRARRAHERVGGDRRVGVADVRRAADVIDRGGDVERVGARRWRGRHPGRFVTPVRSTLNFGDVILASTGQDEGAPLAHPRVEMAALAVPGLGEPLRDGRRAEAFAQQRIDRRVELGATPAPGRSARRRLDDERDLAANGLCDRRGDVGRRAEQLLLVELASARARGRRAGPARRRRGRPSSRGYGAAPRTRPSCRRALRRTQRAAASRRAAESRRKRTAAGRTRTAPPRTRTRPARAAPRRARLPSRAAATRAEPGSLIPGVPASVTTATVSARARARISGVDVRALCS